MNGVDSEMSLIFYKNFYYEKLQLEKGNGRIIYIFETKLMINVLLSISLYRKTFYTHKFKYLTFLTI